MKKRIKLLLCAFALSIGGVTAVGSAQPASALPMSCYQVETAIFFLEGKYAYWQQSYNELHDYASEAYFDPDRAAWMIHVYYTNPWTDTWINDIWNVSHFGGESEAIYGEMEDILDEIDARRASLDTCI
jgi:hypothetical protein